ncbi:MAG: SWIM zinc finger family protein, partial [bacterium]
MQIKSGEILGLATQEIYQRGLEYYLHGRVRLIETDGDTITARVRGKQEYNVSVHRNGNGFLTTCTCPYGFTCKHVIATLLQARDYFNQRHAAPSENLSGQIEKHKSHIG